MQLRTSMEVECGTPVGWCSCCSRC
uniref:Uncharacterized protein n=1 Tax=Rhizophora mucronata TaxID=61149 RepID=A0A2P2PGV4_RHIMU